MAEQEDLIETPIEEVAEKAEKKVPVSLQRSSHYKVLKEFTHKRKQEVGSVFRPRRYPRLRPMKLRQLIADGFIKPLTKKETQEYHVSLKDRASTQPQPVVEEAVDTVVEVNEEE
jgi:hypothetical protein